MLTYADTQARALEESDENGRDTTIFSADLSLVHVWRLPHPQQVVEELPKESRTLSGGGAAERVAHALARSKSLTYADVC
jgi:hypothetical protein